VAFYSEFASSPRFSQCCLLCVPFSLSIARQSPLFLRDQRYAAGSTISWSASEMEYLQDSELAQSTRALLSKIQSVFRVQIQPLQQHYKPQLDGIDFTRFLWAWVCVGSRTFGRFLPYPSLVPFADMLNHVNVHTTYCWDGANAVYFNDARAPAAAGSELCFSCAAPALPKL
jgi:hypothetical protein